MPEKKRLQPEGNKGVRVGQGYEGVGHAVAKVFRYNCESTVAYAIPPL
jgi:hypothetical protein